MAVPQPVPAPATSHPIPTGTWTPTAPAADGPTVRGFAPSPDPAPQTPARASWRDRGLTAPPAPEQPAGTAPATGWRPLPSQSPIPDPDAAPMRRTASSVAQPTSPVLPQPSPPAPTAAAAFPGAAITPASAAAASPTLPSAAAQPVHETVPAPPQAMWEPVPTPAPDGEPVMITDAPADLADDDEAPVVKQRSYTWLHLVVLALVAFVLGWVIFLLLDNASSSTTGALGAGTLVQSVAALGPPTR